MSYLFKDVFITLTELGILDVILPLVFVLVIVFAVLEKVKVFGHINNSRAIHALIALVIAFMFIFSGSRVAALNTVLQKVAILAVVTVLIQLVAGSFGSRIDFLKTKWFTVLLFAVVLLVFSTTFNLFGTEEALALLEFFISPAMIMFFVFAGVIWFITRYPGTGVQNTKLAKNNDKNLSKEPQSPAGQPYRPVENGVINAKDYADQTDTDIIGRRS